MELWLTNSVLPSVIAAAVLLLVLWPTTHSGKRVLVTWGIQQPSDDQIATAVRYLRHRRVLYVVLLLAVPPALGAIAGSSTIYLGVYAPLLVAMLIAELIATLRPARGVRVAPLVRRDWRDILPAWATWTMAAAAACTVVLAVVRMGDGAEPWQALGHLAAMLLLVGTLVALAVRRPAAPDIEVDHALRVRSARVGLGIGFLWVVSPLILAGRPLFADYFGFVVLVGGLLCWLWVAVPTRRSLAHR